MNQTRLENAQRWFLSRYPGGFAHPELALIGKKHRLEKMQDFVRDNFAQKKFRDTDELLADWVKLVSRASLVSIFEKPKFRDLVNDLSPKEKNGFAAGLKGAASMATSRRVFEKILHLLQSYKFAKWSIISLAPVYANPQEEVFIKPTTVKSIIGFLELENLVYRPQPSWEFYFEFRRQIAPAACNG